MKISDLTGSNPDKEDLMKRLTLMSVILFIVFGLSGCDGDLFPTVYEVKYNVTGSAFRVDITYQDEDGERTQLTNVALPWEYSIEVEEDQEVYISAQNKGETGSVTVTIYRDDVEFRKSTNSGPYMTATAQGTL